MITKYFKLEMTSILKFLRQHLSEDNALEWFSKANAYAEAHSNNYIPAIVAMVRTYDMPYNKELIQMNAARDGFEFLDKELFCHPSSADIERTICELKNFITTRNEESTFRRIIITL